MNTASKATRGFIAGLDIDIMPKKAPSHAALDAIQPDPSQPRKTFDEHELRELADSIKANGVLSPIGVLAAENGVHTIVFGERRWRAAKLAGLSDMPITIVDPAKVNVRAAQLVENIQRSKLTPEEIAVAIDELAKGGMKAGEIAAQLGMSKSRVTEFRAIIDMPAALRAHVNQIGAATAYQLFGRWKKHPQEVEVFLISTPIDGINRQSVSLLGDALSGRGSEQAADQKTSPVPNKSGSTAPVSASSPVGGNVGLSSNGRKPGHETPTQNASQANQQSASEPATFPQVHAETEGQTDLAHLQFIVKVGEEFGRLLVDQTGPDSRTALVAFNQGADIRPVALSEITIFEIVGG